MSARFYQTFTELLPYLEVYGLRTDGFRFVQNGKTFALMGDDQGRLYVRFPDQSEGLLARPGSATPPQEGALRVSLPTLARILNKPATDLSAWLAPLGVRLQGRWACVDGQRFELREQRGEWQVRLGVGWRPLVTREQELVLGTALQLQLEASPVTLSAAL